jgi:hypothetical protein
MHNVDQDYLEFGLRKQQIVETLLKTNNSSYGPPKSTECTRACEAEKGLPLYRGKGKQAHIFWKGATSDVSKPSISSKVESEIG